MNNNEHVLLCIIGRTACVDKDTEYFNGTKWKPISEYSPTDMVLQYHDDTGIADLVHPNDYIAIPCERLWHFQSKGTDQCLSDEHILCYDYTGKSKNKHPKSGRMLEITMKDMRVRHNAAKHGFSGKFRTTFSFSGSGITLSDDELRLMVAVIADGSFQKERNSNRCSFHLKKERKKERLRWLAQQCSIPIQEKEDTMPGYTNFYLYAPMRIKQFPTEWYQCNRHQFEIIWDEYKYWDGYFRQREGIPSYTSKHKTDVDFMQFVAATNGVRATIQIDDRINRFTIVNDKKYPWNTITYCATFSSKSSVTIENIHESKCEIKEYVPSDGMKYCFNVPSGKLVLRRNNKIFITHNCGKDTLVNKLSERTGLRQLISYTTRDRRQNEGDTHRFVSDADYQDMLANNQVAVDSNIAGNYYWSVIPQLYEADIYIVDYVGYKKLKNLNLPNLRLVSIYINVPDEVRKERALNLRKDDKRRFMQRDFDEREQFRSMLRNADFDYAISNIDVSKAYSVLRWIATVEGAWKNIDKEEV